MAIVEVGMMGVQAGKTPMDPATADGKILRQAWESVIRASEGPKRVLWGTEFSDPSRIWGFFDWESIEQHEAFARSFGGEATKRFGEVFTPGFTKHAHFSTTSLSSPVTEIMLLFFPNDISNSTRNAVSTQYQRFRDNALEHCVDMKGVSGGWGLENDFPLHHLSGGGELNKGCLFFAMIGWVSVDAATAFCETKEYEEHVHSLRQMKACVGMDKMMLKCELLERAA